LSNDWIDSVGRMGATPAPRGLAEPLAVMQLALRSPGEAKVRYSNYRFSRLVASRLQLNDLDMASFPEILELDLASPSMQQSSHLTINSAMSLRVTGCRRFST
jgi:hypothetical protein